MLKFSNSGESSSSLELVLESKTVAARLGSSPTVRGGGVLTQDVELRGALYREPLMEFNARFDGKIHALRSLTLGLVSVVKGTIRVWSAVMVMSQVLGDSGARAAVRLKSSAVVMGNASPYRRW